MQVSLHNIQYRADGRSTECLQHGSVSEADACTVALFITLKGGIRRPAVRRVCEVCGTPFLARRDKVRAGQGTTCSPLCACRKATRFAPPPPCALRGHSRRDGLKHPAIVRAHQAVHRALADGRLVPDAVCACGASPVVAHHEDYGKPLNVVWLCRSCHLRRHYEMGRLGIQPKGARWPKS